MEKVLSQYQMVQWCKRLRKRMTAQAKILTDKILAGMVQHNLDALTLEQW